MPQLIYFNILLRILTNVYIARDRRSYTHSKANNIRILFILNKECSV